MKKIPGRPSGQQNKLKNRIMQNYGRPVRKQGQYALESYPNLNTGTSEEFT